MATLEEALAGLNYTGADTGYGIAAQTLNQATPQLINPYGSTGQAVGIGLGSILLQSLLGYQARQQASQDTLELNTLANSMQDLGTAQSRTDFIKSVEDPMYQGRLSSLATALNAQDLQNKNAINRAAGLETGKMKALQQFYASPEGAAQREFELNKIREETQARRTGLPFEEQMALILARNTGGLEKQQQADATKLKIAELQTAATSGDKQKQREWKAEQDKQQREFDENLVRLKASVGTEATVARKQQIDALKMENIRNGEDPDLALANARAEVNKQIAQDLITQKDELASKRMQEYNKAIEDRMILRKQIDQDFPQLGQQIKNSTSEAGPYANLAKTLAADLRQLSSFPEYKAVKNISALGGQFKSRTADIVDRLARVRSGLATRGAEDDTFETIVLGDSSVGPQEAANILERIANDTLRVAADKLSAGTQSPAALVQLYRQAAEKNTTVPLEPNIFQGQSAQAVGGTAGAAQMFVSSLKDKYGADWKTKMTPAEKTAAAALLQARGQ
jgi:hypothetical protein